VKISPELGLLSSTVTMGTPTPVLGAVCASCGADGRGGGSGVSALRKVEERERRDGIAPGEYRVRGTDLPTPGGG
jgi:hypothetical protein